MSAPVVRDRHTRLGIAVALLVLAADQASKWWILNVLHLPELHQVWLLPVLDLTMVWNRGVTFGLLNGLGGWGSAVLGVLALCVVAALGRWLRRAESRLTAAALGAIAGGAVGNVIDRARFGAVVDFIRAHVGVWSWPVFNLADAAIVCGVAALVIGSQWGRRTDEDGTGKLAEHRGSPPEADAPLRRRQADRPSTG
jgi:lipoprotein signal peptidase